jgi:hypothetical protein
MQKYIEKANEINWSNPSVAIRELSRIYKDIILDALETNDSPVYAAG